MSTSNEYHTSCCMLETASINQVHNTLHRHANCIPIVSSLYFLQSSRRFYKSSLSLDSGPQRRHKSSNIQIDSETNPKATKAQTSNYQPHTPTQSSNDQNMCGLASDLCIARFKNLPSPMFVEIDQEFNQTDPFAWLACKWRRLRNSKSK